MSNDIPALACTSLNAQSIGSILKRYELWDRLPSTGSELVEGVVVVVEQVMSLRDFLRNNFFGHWTIDSLEDELDSESVELRHEWITGLICRIVIWVRNDSVKESAIDARHVYR